VELEAEGEPAIISLEELKTLILKSFRERHGWSTRGDFEELPKRVREAGTIGEIIELLGE
jgi:hypothetical protein